MKLRKQFFLSASFISLGIYFALNSFAAFVYGAHLPESMLTYALIIAMSGILMNGVFVLLMTGLTMSTTVVISFLMPKNMELTHPPNIIIIGMIFILIAWVLWLYQREIKRSLMWAIGIKEEKISQLYRFAEFGKLSSGVFHDIANPLTAIALAVEGLKRATGYHEYADKALLATEKLQGLVVAARKQLAGQENNTVFSINNEIKGVMDILSHKARQADVSLTFYHNSNILIFGDTMRFNQVVLNLIDNAIDAYDQVPRVIKKRVLVDLLQKDDLISFSVQDFGAGIHQKHLHNIFEPFFTTKAQGQGIGIGLSITKDIVQKNFKGTINVESKLGQGTICRVTIPASSSF